MSSVLQLQQRRSGTDPARDLGLVWEKLCAGDVHIYRSAVGPAFQKAAHNAPQKGFQMRAALQFFFQTGTGCVSRTKGVADIIPNKRSCLLIALSA
jgi:hypothetical protein